MSIGVDDIEKQDAVATEAVDWFLRIEREEPAIETLAAWQRWLELSPAHRTAYEATQRTWTALDTLSASRWEEGQTAGAPTARAGRRGGTAGRMRRLVWAAAASLGITTALALLTVRSMTGDAYRTTIETTVGEHRELVLPDKSRVQVGAHSALEIRLTSRAREVRLLSGEAFFSVAQDISRPFVVDAGMSKVTAIGTAFNVRRYGDVVAVEVAEGRIRLEPATTFMPNAGAATVLRQGEETVVERSGVIRSVRALASDNVAAWRNGRHSYIDEPLSRVIADLNRYSTRPVVIDDPALARLRITTTFFSTDWQGWLHTLASAAPALQIKEDRDTMRIVSKAAATAGK